MAPPGQGAEGRVQIDDLISTERHRGVRARLQEKRELIVRWLAASGWLDEETGLPWEYLARYRWIPDPVLGRVPALIDIARESLAGFVLGVMYSHRYIPTDGEGLTAIMVTAYLLADQSEFDPIRGDGPGLW